MTTLKECPPANTLRDLALGKLAEEDSSVVLRHLEGCGDCQGELDTHDTVEDTFVAGLRESDETDDYLNESDYKTAMAKALGALANANAQPIDDREISELLPKVLGDYEIVRGIGRGGMGNVFLARHQRLGREVALKVLSSHRLLQPRMRQRFETEMRAIGQLSHPNIVTAFDAREIDDLAVLVTEYIDGLNVGQVLKRYGKLPPADACEIGRQAADALQYVSEQDLVHRDVKPSNVMVDRAGAVKLLDLGLARLNLGGSEQSDMTATGQAMGTADYVAPEQVNDSRSVDIRADVYALGATLYKMLSGRALFPSSEFRVPSSEYPNNFAKMSAQVREQPKPLQELVPTINKRLAALVHQMLDKDPAKRPQSPADVSDRLKPFAKGAKLNVLVEQAERESPDSEIHSQPATHAFTQASRQKTVWPWLTALGSAAVGLLLGIVITISNSGVKSSLEVPDGSEVAIDAKGNVSVKLGNDSGHDLAFEMEHRMLAGVTVEQLVAMNESMAKLVQRKINGIPKTVAEEYKGCIAKENSGVIRLYRPGRFEDTSATILGCTYYNFAKQTHNYYSHGADIGWKRHKRYKHGVFQTGFAGGDTGLVARIEGKTVRDIAESDIPDFLQLTSQEVLAYEHELLSGEAEVELTRPQVESGALYLVRSIRWSDYDTIFAFQVVSLDEDGATIVWKELKKFPPTHINDRSNFLETVSVDRLRRISLGAHNYLSGNAHFPLTSSRNRSANENTPPHSWRVAILPHIGEAALYERYKFDEPWDSKANLKLLKSIPTIFQEPGVRSVGAPSGMTPFVMLAGPGTLGESRTKLEQIGDGAEKTAMFAVSTAPVPWTKPEDLAVQAFADQVAALVSERTPVAFANGLVREVKRSTSAKQIQAICSINGKEKVDLKDFKAPVSWHWPALK